MEIHVGPENRLTNSSSAFSQPDMRLQHQDGRPGMAHPESRPGVPQQFYQGECRMQHPGLPYPQGSISSGISRIGGMDPRMMFTASPHPDYMSQQGSHPHMMAGMVPQHPSAYLGQQQGAQVERHPLQEGRPSSARPPSRTTPPQPSPRATPTPHQRTHAVTPGQAQASPSSTPHLGLSMTSPLPARPGIAMAMVVAQGHEVAYHPDGLVGLQQVR